MRRKLVATLLVLTLLGSAVPVVSAASESARDAAGALYTLGLFQGTGTGADGSPNFDLDRTPTRAEAVTMLVRLLGRDQEAQQGSWNIPFTDVDAWARPYIGYAYAKGLAMGTGPTTFRGQDSIDATQYLTLILRALGYEESAGDFQWDRAWELSDRLGITEGNYASDSAAFTRGDVAEISFRALSTRLKGNHKTLVRRLLDEKAIPSYDQVEAAGLGWAAALTALSVPSELRVEGGTLSWIPSKPVATGYQISRSGTRDGSFAPWKETAESSIALPQEEGTFWYRVRAVSQENGVLVGVSPLSDAVSYTWTAPAEPPEPQQPEPDPPAAPADPRPSVPSTPQNPGEMPDSVMHEFLVAMEFGMDKLGDGLDRISSANRFGGKGLSAAGSQFSQMAQSCYGDAKEYFARARDICLAYPQARDMEEIGDLLLQVCNEIDRVVSFSVDSGNYAYFIRAIFLSATDSISDCTGRIIQLLQQQQ